MSGCASGGLGTGSCDKAGDCGDRDEEADRPEGHEEPYCRTGGGIDEDDGKELDGVGTALRHKAWFSVTARMDPKVTTAIANIDDARWQPIKYPHAIWQEAEQRWISDAEG